jgi:hypothetical protein
MCVRCNGRGVPADIAMRFGVDIPTFQPLYRLTLRRDTHSNFPLTRLTAKSRTDAKCLILVFYLEIEGVLELFEVGVLLSHGLVHFLF